MFLASRMVVPVVIVLGTWQGQRVVSVDCAAAKHGCGRETLEGDREHHDACQQEAQTGHEAGDCRLG